MDEMKDTLKNLKKVRRISLLISSIGCAPFFLMIFCVFVVVLFVLGIFDGGGSSSGGGKVASNNGECGFTISQTSLSKSEFKQKIQEYANGHSQWQPFADNANDYYDYAKAKGVNPEIVITIAWKENGGHTTSGSNNYWGLACPNGATSCGSYGSFMEGAKMLIDSASNYSTLMDWFDKGHYSWIGDYWYNPGNSGLGGCYYAPYIYADDMPSRVKNACSSSASYCGSSGGSGCVATQPEDQTAYAKWLIDDKMVPGRKAIFGLDGDEGVSCTSLSSDVVEKYVQWMIDFAADDSHGYSQSTRDMNPNVDCSSFVYYGLTKGGSFDLGINYAFSTHDMTELLKAVGFKVYKYTSVDELKRGDILWTESHTEVYIGDGQNVGAHSDYDGVNGDSGGKEVSVSNNWRTWTYYFRYES